MKQGRHARRSCVSHITSPETCALRPPLSEVVQDGAIMFNMVLYWVDKDGAQTRGPQDLLGRTTTGSFHVRPDIAAGVRLRNPQPLIFLKEPCSPSGSFQASGAPIQALRSSRALVRRTPNLSQQPDRHEFRPTKGSLDLHLWI